MSEQMIREAKQALRKNAFADFAQQAPALRQFLLHLPILSAQAPALAAYPPAAAQRGDLAATLERLAKNWRAYNPPNSHEGAVDALIGDEMELLTAVFSATVWGMTSEQGRLAVARIAEDTYLFWSFR